MKTSNRKPVIFLMIILSVMINAFRANSQDIDMTGSLATTNFQGIIENIASQNNVELSTGVLVPRIPIAKIAGRDLTASVSFVYTNGSGYRQDSPPDILDHLGKGWKLNAGGYIKRTVRGIRDDKFYGQTPFSSDHANARGWLDLITNIDSYSTFHNNHPNDKWYQATLWEAQNQNVGHLVLNDLAYSGGSPGNITQTNWNNGRYWYYSGVTHNCEVKEFDSEPDLFEYNLNGNTGTFIFDENGQPMFLQESNIKIETPTLNAYDGGDWILTTQDGTRYIFENNDNFREITTETNQTGIYDDPNSTQQNEAGSTREYVSTWHLTRIESITGDQINFNYLLVSNYSSDFWAYATQDYSPGFIAGTNVTDPTSDPDLQANVTGGGESGDSYYTRLRKNISSIETSRGKIEFGYNATGKALISIKQYNKDNLLQKSFEIPEFYPAGEIIQKPVDGSINDLVYSFEYFDASFINENPNNLDWWGYCNVNAPQQYPHHEFAPWNGTIINGYPFSLSGSSRMPNFPYSTAGVLKKIIYPTGGSTEFEYEQNDFWNTSSNSNEQIGGLRIKKIIEHDGTNTGNDVITEYSYHKLNSTQSSGESACDFNYLCTVNGFFILHPTLFNPGSLSRLKYFVSRSSSPQIVHSQDYIRYSHVEVRQPGKGKTAYDLTAFSDHPDTDPETREFNYGLATNFTNYYLPSQGINGMKNDNSMERGLVTHKSIYDEAGTLLNDINYDFEFHPPGYAEKIVKGMQLFSHNFFSYVANSSGITSSPCGEHNESGLNYSAEYYSVKSRWIYLKKIRTNDYDQTAAGNSVYNEKETFYDNLQHKQPTQEKMLNSDGTHSRIYYKYNTELYASGPNDESTDALNIMQQKNIVLPIQIIQTEEKNGVEKIVSGTVSSFKIVNGIPCLHKKYNMETNGDVDFSTSYFVNVNNNGNFIINPVFQNYSQFSNYSQYGQPLETINKDGTVTSTIYDKNFNNVIASVNNASVSGDECDFWDFDRTPVSFNQFSSIVSDAHTGTGSNRVDPDPDPGNGHISYSYGKDFFPSNHNRKYKVSAWVKTENGFGNIAGKEGSLVICAESAPYQPYSTSSSYNATPIHDTQGKWKYFEAFIDLPKVKTEIPLQVTSPIGFSTYAVNYDDNHYFLIDDIRVQPAENCLMNTIAIDNIFDCPSSKSDARNSPLYYEYDNYGRESIIRDENENILKKYEYNSIDVLSDPLITTSFYYSALLINQVITIEGYGYSNKSAVNYLFNFGDGTTSTSPTNNHSYTAPGDYTISLTVTDAANNSKTTSKTLHINDSPIIAQMHGPTNLQFYHLINLTPHHAIGHYNVTLSGGYGPYTYTWGVGIPNIGSVYSGSPSTNDFFDYTFGPGNTYVVSCTIHDSAGNMTGASITVQVVCIW